MVPDIAAMILTSAGRPADVIPADLSVVPLHIFDLTEENRDLTEIDIRDTAPFSTYISREMDRHNAAVGIGRYNEDRTIYRRSTHFETEHDPRTIHLGIDLWVNAETPVQSPYNAVVHSTGDNNTFGDYGPTIILTHTLSNITFHTLYGHLSTESITDIRPGMPISAGSTFAAVGAPPRNGDWPPHLHFQLIRDMTGYVGDYPGVASRSEREEWCRRCPDPAFLLKLNGRI